MPIVIALCLILIAGVINGAFALPTKYTKLWKFENIWLQYAVWAFIVLPWVSAYFLAPQILTVYAKTPPHLLMTMVFGGFLFGAGQVGFAFAIDMIGIGLAFVICLGLGTGFGFLLPLVFQHAEDIFTPFGLVTLIGTTLAITGIVVSTIAGQVRDKDKRALETEATQKPKHFYFLGVFLAVIAGFFSAGQNFTFSLTSEMQTIATHVGVQPLGASMIMWPGFLIFTFIPYAGYMLYLHQKNRSFGDYKKPKTKKYFLFASAMGACWFGSLIFYSKASQLIGQLGPVVGWPIFMVLIILTSNVIGWRYDEWKGSSRCAIKILWISLLLLIASVLVLGYSSLIHA